MIALSVAPSHKKIGPETKTFDVLQSLTSKSKAVKTRPTLNIAIAIDASGSMGGAPIEDAKKAAINFINRLNENDRVSVVSYSSSSQVLIGSGAANETWKQKAILAVTALSAGGGTALHQGWLLAAQQVAPFVSDFSVSRVIVLSDGQANVGPSNPDVLREEASQLAAAGVGTTTCGLGYGFNEDLMTSLAQGGRAFYAASSDQIDDYFNTELDLMSMVVAKGVRFKSTVVYGKGKNKISVSLRPLNDSFDLEDGYFSAPDVVAQAHSWLVFSHEIDQALLAKHKSFTLICEACYTDLADQKHTDTVKTDFELASKEILGKNQDVQERVKELLASRIQREAAAAARKGLWADVDTHIASLRGLAGSNAYVQGVAASLSNLSQQKDANLFSKEAAFASYTMSTRNISIHEDVADQNDTLGLRKSSQTQSKKSASSKSSGDQHDAA